MNPTLKEDLTLLDDVIKSIRKKLKDKIRHKKYYTNNREKVKSKSLQYDVKNREKKREYNSLHTVERNKWRTENKDKIKLHNIKYESTHKKIRKLYRDTHKEEKKKYRKQYYLLNRERLITNRIKRAKIDYNTNTQYKLQQTLRNRLRSALKGDLKAGSAVKDLGCTISELKLYLESKFQEGMTWNNWSQDGWHIDHIKPISSFDLTDRKQLLEACHYTNLQPLWAKDNLSKGDTPIYALNDNSSSRAISITSLA